MSTEAAGGKKPVSHVGKIHNLLSNQLAGKLYSQQFDAIEAATACLQKRSERGRL